MADWDPEAFTKALIADLRANRGKVSSGPLAGRHLLVLTSTGAKTRLPRTAILTWSRDGDDYVVAASKSGAPKNPLWLHNVLAHPDVTVEAEGEVFPARARVAVAQERDVLWDRHVAKLPEFADYPQKSGGRIIPIVVLKRAEAT
jgi:deazaflavin-dependent oxidoreductase (nitroreductase family)